MQPPIYVINLDRSPARLVSCQQRLNTAKVTFERIHAVDGAALNDDQLHSFYSAERNQKEYYKTLTPGEIGCYMSHRKAWQKIASGQSRYGIVLEDDINVVGDLSHVMQALNSLSFNWDTIKLAPYKTTQRSIAHSVVLTEQFNLVTHTKPMTGCAAYALTKQAAIKLLAHSTEFGRPVDTDIQHFWEKNIHVFSLMPYPIQQDLAFNSEMQDRKQRRKSHRARRLKQQVSAFLRNKIAVKQQIRTLKAELVNTTETCSTVSSVIAPSATSSSSAPRATTCPRCATTGPGARRGTRCTWRCGSPPRTSIMVTLCSSRCPPSTSSLAPNSVRPTRWTGGALVVMVSTCSEVELACKTAPSSPTSRTSLAAVRLLSTTGSIV